MSFAHYSVFYRLLDFFPGDHCPLVVSHLGFLVSRTSCVKFLWGIQTLKYPGRRVMQHTCVCEQSEARIAKYYNRRSYLMADRMGMSGLTCRRRKKVEKLAKNVREQRPRSTQG